MVQAPHPFYISESSVLLDLRSVARFTKGTLPGAVSFPVEEHQQHGEIRKLIAQQWPAQLVRVFDEKGAYETLFRSPDGIHYLQGGYSAYLRWQDELFREGPPIIILGGKAGAGKTECLHQLELRGEQVIDLENLAGHKGSVFGNLTNSKQPSNDEFRHRIFERWFGFNKQQCVWIEEEGPFLGRTAVPSALYARILDAPLLHMEMDFAQRLEHIIAEYGNEPGAQFTSAIRKLEERMGMSANQKTIHLYTTGNIAGAFRLLLEYYDQAYMERRLKYRRGPQQDVHAGEAAIETLIETGKSIVKKEPRNKPGTHK
jgi:tRNA 2-selenouridine synthase SelU